MNWVTNLLGLERGVESLGFGHMAARAAMVFMAGVVLLRLGARRGLGHSAGFDILLMVILGSVLSRGINGTAPFFPTLGASLVLVALHAGLAWLTARSHRFSRLAKGKPVAVVRDGRIDEAALRRSCLSHDDLIESLRLNGNITELAEVAEARLERNGEVSVTLRLKS